MPEVKGPYLGMKIPEDLCFDTDAGRRCFRDYKGRWLLLFSHPGDFRPVCTTEFIAFAKKYEEFKKRGVELLGLSVDTVYSHVEWKRQIKQLWGVEIPFPIISDVPDFQVANLFNSIPPGTTATVRMVALIDPELKLVWFALYPLAVGRGVDEILRVIDAIQFNYKHGYLAPVDWRPGDPVIVPPPQRYEGAEKRLKETGIECKTWWFCTKKYEEVVG
ncbi:3-Cys thioredoxin peroxidase [Pyrobaculum islandicum DSM 4184]|uniref:Peroxiredoxin n=1 Tax=Pyrobaculum islandicum (strain DSM 4184 / JCM 9189 / GEO3) TaxID=384616 RepID=A1RQW6_PYRIL|nr:peroxiredoxin [Pyrobaculum islandicum]ABL87348.1 3-Cys thioredoxin peroxidase [Pyrobaculum islandicum DSM 4184]